MNEVVEVDLQALTPLERERILGEVFGKPKGQKQTNAKKVMIDGRVFPSGAEARRYIELKDLLERGVISHLTLQPPFVIIDAFRGCDGKVYDDVVYTPDFMYQLPADSGEWHVDEVKGRVFKDYPLRKKGFLVRWGALVQFHEIAGRSDRRHNKKAGGTSRRRRTA